MSEQRIMKPKKIEAKLETEALDKEVETELETIETELQNPSPKTKIIPNKKPSA